MGDFSGIFQLLWKSDVYRQISISPGLIFVQKTFWWAHFRGRLFSEGLIIENRTTTTTTIFIYL